MIFGKHVICCRVAAVFFFAVSFLSIGNSQSESAAIRGTVVDPTGAVIPEATVRLIDVDRGTTGEAATGNRGFYSFAGVRPGSYQMEVAKAGFKVLHLTGVTVNVVDSIEQNFTLEVGPVSESITIEANANNINTTDGSVSTVVERHFIDNLPLNGRSFQTLILLTPGVVTTSTIFNDQGQFSVNGQRADGNYFSVDGVSANFGVTGYFPMVQTAGGALPALNSFGGTNSLVSLDSMEEFRVQTSSFAPEFGRTPGGQISIATRSGTNAFHGTLFDYFRNDVLDARDWFINFNHLRKPAERQNDFGGVVGGPILKDKTFFFFSYEGLRLRQPASQQTAVPDGASRQAAPPTIRPYLNVFPIPNGAVIGAGLAQFNASYSNPSSLDAYSLRVDHLVNSKMSLFGRYNYSPSSFDQRNSVLSMTQSLSSSVQTVTLGLAELINSRISNELRANYSNQRIGTKFFLDGFGGAVPLLDSALFPIPYNSHNGLFSFSIVGAGQYNQGKSAIDEQRQINFIDNLSLSRSGHSLKVGVDYRWLAPFSSPFLYRQFVQFSGMSANPGGALSGTAQVAATFANQANALFAQNVSLYGQDSWKITDRLTVTYGLRWDINPALRGKNSANDPFTVTGLDNPATLALASRGTPLYDTTYGNVAPRVGVAFQLRGTPNWTSVVSGGFGTFYDLGQGSLGAITSFFPYEVSSIVQQVPFPLSAQTAAPPPFTTSPPVNTIQIADPHLKLPRVYQWNGALEQAMGIRQRFTLTYVGAVGRDLLRLVKLFNLNPDFQNVNVTNNTATSDYHALQAHFERRLSQGLQALASYTWSHSIDIASSDAATNLNTPSFLASSKIDRGDSDFDIRHSFTAGVTYDLPAPGRENIVSRFLSGWSVDSFVLARSAPPVNVIGSTISAAGVTLAPRPNVVPGVPLEFFGSQYPGGKIFNKAAFSAPPSGEQGDFSRNVLRGFGASQVDLGLQKQFHMTEKAALRFRSEFFNIFNHPNFGRPTNNLTSGLFGRSTQTLANNLGSGGANGGFSPLYQIGGPRSIQLALRLQF